MFVLPAAPSRSPSSSFTVDKVSVSVAALCSLDSFFSFDDDRLINIFSLVELLLLGLEESFRNALDVILVGLECVPVLTGLEDDVLLWPTRA